MMEFMFGGKKPEKQKTPAYRAVVGKVLQCQLCGLCKRTFIKKVVYGENVKPIFTCSNCELQAVGNSSSRLVSNLMTIDEFSDILVREVCDYQLHRKDPTQEQRQPEKAIESLVAEASKIQGSLLDEWKAVRITVDGKLQELQKESVERNSSMAFEEVEKMKKDYSMLGNGEQILRHAKFGPSGLYFLNKEAISAANAEINGRFDQVKTISKVSLKNLESLITQINETNFEFVK